MHKSLILLLALLLVSVKAFKPKSEKSGFLFRFFRKSKSKNTPPDMPQETLQPQIAIPTVSLSDFASPSFPHVPPLITGCINQIHRKCPKFEGQGKPCDLREVFRLSIKSADLKRLFMEYVNTLEVPEVDPIACGSLIKMFLRELDGGIMNGQLKKCLTDKSSRGNPLLLLKTCIEGLPTANRETLATVMIDAYKTLDAMINNAEIKSQLEGSSVVSNHEGECTENIIKTLGVALFLIPDMEEVIADLGPEFRDDFSNYAGVELNDEIGQLKGLSKLPLYLMTRYLEMGQGYWTKLLAKDAEITELPYPPQPSGAGPGLVLVES